MAIVTEQELRAYYRTEIPGESALVLAAIAATESTVNEMCQRQFVVAGSAAARTYVPRVQQKVLRIHDCTSVTSVVENGTTLTAGTDYQKEPVQTVSWSGETRPYTQLRRLGGYWYTSDETGTVVVTAPWGWTAIPTVIKQAVYIGSKEILDAREIKFGIAAINDFGPLRVRENPQVLQLVGPYMRREAFGIA